MPRSLLIFAVTLVFPALASAQVKLLAVGSVPGNAVDKSGLTDKLADGVPHNRLGGFGSALAWTGLGNRYVLVPDRGPNDGEAKYQCRFHLADILVTGDKLQFQLVDTKILRDSKGVPFVGSSKALNHRLDPEGVRVSAKGTIYISDEYGPYLWEFDNKGNWLHAFKVPQSFLIAKPSGSAKQELALNKNGRVPNRGMEGLALTPDGKNLVGAMQSPLIQDGGREGLFCRILEVAVTSGKTRQFVYPLVSNLTGICEILAISNDEFLVLERDGKKEPNRVCKIYRINLAKASNVSDTPVLPKQKLPPGVHPVSKSLFLDLTTLGLNLPPKIEGLAFGPDLPDGRKLLLITSDNDLLADQPTMIYAFAVGF